MNKFKIQNKTISKLGLFTHNLLLTNVDEILGTYPKVKSDSKISETEEKIRSFISSEVFNAFEQ